MTSGSKPKIQAKKALIHLKIYGPDYTEYEHKVNMVQLIDLTNYFSLLF